MRDTRGSHRTDRSLTVGDLGVVPPFEAMSVGQKAAILLLAREFRTQFHITYLIDPSIPPVSVTGVITDACLSRDQADHFHEKPERLIITCGNHQFDSRNIVSIVPVEGLSLRGESFPARKEELRSE